MATPESIAAAFAKGMMEAMLAQPEAKPKEKRPKVVATSDLDDSLRRVLPEVLAHMAQEPVQEPLFGVDIGDEVYRRQKIAEAEARAAQRDAPEEMTMGYYDANEPGEKSWTSVGNN